jgi:hypothetical protein
MRIKKEKVIFAAVDRKYYRKYAAAWAWSIFQNNMHGHIHVIDPVKKDIESLHRLKKLTLGHIQFSTGDIKSDLPRDRCYFASFRFLYLQHLNDLYQKVLVTDIDSIIRQKVQFPDQDFGFYLREGLKTNDNWFAESSKIAAGIFFVNLNKKNIDRFTYLFNFKLDELRSNNSWRWMVDQNALFFVFKSIEEEKIFKIHQFTKKDFSWNFEKRSNIWTGKGERKHKSPRYLKEFMKYNAGFTLASCRAFLRRIISFD